MKQFYTFPFLTFFIMSLSSCKTAKEVALESAIELIQDPKTGTQVFVREADTEPYGINLFGIIKARKKLKKQKMKEILDNY